MVLYPNKLPESERVCSGICKQMKGITLVGCWAHGRRKYVDALEENRTLVTQAIHYIGRLYKVESDAG